MKKKIRYMFFRSLAGLLALCLPALFAAAEEETPVYTVNEWNFVDGSMDVSHGIPETANGVLARIRERGVLRVATEPYFAPQEFIDPDLEGQERYVGADMKLARLIAERMGVDLVIVPMDFTEVLRAVSEDECDLAISALAFTPGRASSNEMSKGYYYSDAPSNIVMVIREEDKDKYRTADDFSEATLAAQRGSLQESAAVENLPKYKEFRRLVLTQDVYDAVSSGDADAGAVDMENAENYIRNNPDCGLVMAEGISFSLDEQYAGDRIAAKKGETELLYFVNGVIDEVTDSGLYEEWYEEAQARADELDL